MTMFSQGSADGPGELEDGDLLGWSLASGDLTGDGVDDLVVGVPGDRAATGTGRPGSALVIRGDDGGLGFDGSMQQLFGWRETDRSDQGGQPGFGWSVAVGQFRGGGAAELAVGAPLEAPNSRTAQGGRVYTFRDGRGGLTADQVIGQDDGEIGPGTELHDRFGWALAAGDLDGDGHDDLAVGAPFEDVGEPADAGQVSVFGGATTGLGALGVVDRGPDGDGERFGWALAIGDHRLLVGAPHHGDSLAGAAYLAGPDLSADLVATGGSGSRLGMAAAMVALTDSRAGGDRDAVVGAPGTPGPSALPDGNLAGAVRVLGAEELHQDTAHPEVADSREPAWTPMPCDDVSSEPHDPATEPGGEWFGWSVAS